MTTYKKVGVVVLQYFEYRRRVMTRVAADVGEEHFESIAGEEVGGRHPIAEVVVVHIAINPAEGFELRELFVYPTSHVARMPQLVAVFKEGIHLLGHGAMSVRKNAYPLHSLACISARFSATISLRYLRMVRSFMLMPPKASLTSSVSNTNSPSSVI